MNDMWLKALILACTFGAVVLAVETAVRWLAGPRGTLELSQPGSRGQT